MKPFLRGKVWYIRFFCGGKRITKAVGPSKRQAELALGKIKAEIVEGKFLEPLKGDKVTYGQVLDRYLKEHCAVRKGRESYREAFYLVREIKGVLGNLLLKEVVPDRISPWIEELVGKGMAASTINHRITILKHSLTLAKRWGYIRYNQLVDIKCLREPTGRLRYLEPVELQRLVGEVPDYQRPIVLMAAHTGMRLGEIVSLRWDQVNLSQAVITLTRTKNGEPRGVPLNSTALGVVRDLSRVRMRRGCSSPYVFLNPLTGNPWDYIGRGFRTAVKRAGICDFRFHDLRHTAASWMVMNGVDLLTVAEILGHKDLRMTRRYSHLSPGHRRDAVSVLDSALKVAEAASAAKGGYKSGYKGGGGRGAGGS